jgi:ribosome modulation factor
MTKSEAMKFITEKHGECYLNGWLERMKDEFVAPPREQYCQAGVCKGMTKSEAMKFITEKHGECYLNGWLVRMKDEFGTSQPRVEQICHRPKHHRDVERVEQLCKRFRRVAPVVLLVIALLLRRCAW